MKEQKLNRILEAARTELPPAVPADFEPRVLRQVLREPRPAAISFFGQVDRLFPRLACAAALAIVIFIAGDCLLAALEPSDLAEGAARISNQWFLPVNGI
jgi:hypothetical protein